MFGNSYIKTFMVLMAALFFTMQGFSQAHAASNGDLDHHHHDGVACDIALIAAEHTVLTPPAPVPTPLILPTRVKTIGPTVKPIMRSFDSRAPPPRAPPL